MSRRFAAICIAVASATTIGAATASATDLSAAKQPSGIFCDNGVAPAVVFTVSPNGTIKVTDGDIMAGVVGAEVIGDLGHRFTVQVFATTKAGTNEYRFDGAPQSSFVVPFEKKKTTVNVCVL